MGGPQAATRTGGGASCSSYLSCGGRSPVLGLAKAASRDSLPAGFGTHVVATPAHKRTRSDWCTLDALTRSGADGLRCHWAPLCGGSNERCRTVVGTALGVGLEHPAPYLGRGPTLRLELGAFGSVEPSCRRPISRHRSRSAGFSRAPQGAQMLLRWCVTTTASQDAMATVGDGVASLRARTRVVELL